MDQYDQSMNQDRSASLRYMDQVGSVSLRSIKAWIKVVSVSLRQIKVKVTTSNVSSVFVCTLLNKGVARGVVAAILPTVSGFLRLSVSSGVEGSGTL